MLEEIIKIRRLFWTRLRCRGYPPGFLTTIFEAVEPKPQVFKRRCLESDNTIIFCTTHLHPIPSEIIITRFLNSLYFEMFKFSSEKPSSFFTNYFITLIQVAFSGCHMCYSANCQSPPADVTVQSTPHSLTVSYRSKVP